MARARPREARAATWRSDDKHQGGRFSRALRRAFLHDTAKSPRQNAIWRTIASRFEIPSKDVRPRDALRIRGAISPNPMNLIRCDATHAAPILAILNDAIVNSTALYDYQPRTPEMMTAWFETKARGNFPVIGVTDDGGALMGFGSYGTFRAWPAYKYTVEHSIYVAAPFRRRGLGRTLLREVIAAAQMQSYHVLIGGIDAANAVSIALHRKLGFTHAGTIKHAGFKFGRWLDLDFYQLILPTPAVPVDG
jgi:L-amino acid N-acyltransferase